MKRRVVSIIPARKGSKRLENKNVKRFCGKPLAHWTFDFVENSNIFDVNYVSTDIDELEKEVEGRDNFKFCVRPFDLAKDGATLLDVIRYTCVEESLDKKDIVVLLPVTGPLRVLSDIEGAVNVFLKGDGETIVSVSESPYPAGMLWKKDDNNALYPLLPDEFHRTTQKQKHFPTYQFNDLFVVDSVEGFLDPERDLYGNRTKAYLVPPERSMPIDYQYQYSLAEQLFVMGQKKDCILYSSIIHWRKCENF